MVIGDTAALYILMAAVGGPAFMYLFTFVLFTRHIERLVTQSREKLPAATPPLESSLYHEHTEERGSTEAAPARR